MAIYIIPERNYSGIQFEQIRQKIDPDYTDAHDELSQAYYDKKPYRDMGILDKETFDKLHGLIELKRQIAFTEAHAEEKLISPGLKDHNIDIEAVNIKLEEITKEVDIEIGVKK
jgi:hypothetical protein